MATASKQIGLEDRKSILPTPDIPDKTPGIFGPDYSFADNIPLPGQVGVRDGGSLNDVVDAVKGAAYYVDVIGFGQPSNPLTYGMDIRPIGVSTWMKSGMKCSNGADMWTYISGLPKGDALGQRVAAGIASAGLPQMKGLAPGMLEDVKAALDPTPVMNAVFGTGYPECVYAAAPVGDQNGFFQNFLTKSYFVENPETVTCLNGAKPINGACIGSMPVQKRWTQKSLITKEAWDNAPKTHCPDGYPTRNHKDNDCKKELLSREMKDGFYDRSLDTSFRNLVYGVAVSGVVLFAVIQGSIRLRK